MAETAGEKPKAPAIWNITWLFGVLVVLAAIILFAGRKWPSAVGLLIGLLPYLWMAQQIRNVLRRTRNQRSRSTGARTMAAINGTAGVVILFAGALVGGDVILVFTAIFGIWMIGAAMLLVLASGFGSRTSSGEKFVQGP